MSKGDVLFHFGTLLSLIVVGLILKVDCPFYVALGFSIGRIVEVLSNCE